MYTILLVYFYRSYATEYNDNITIGKTYNNTCKSKLALEGRNF
jgi:hypothetical protein